VLATMNRPLITAIVYGWMRGHEAELQVGSAVIRMSGSTSVTLLNLEDRVAQVQLAQGTLNYSGTAPGSERRDRDRNAESRVFDPPARQIPDRG
jgi:hypothetical protein